MKRKALFFVLLIMTSLISLSACSNETSDSGNGHVHEYTEKLTYVEGAEIRPSTCTQNGEYYYVCKCGAVGTETYTAGLAYHDFSEKIEDADHLASEATCTESKKYYYTCKNCSAISEDTTFSSGDRANHNFVDNVCTYGCGEELQKYTLSENGEYYTLTKYNENLEVITVPATYKGLPVKAIGEHAFASVDVKEVILPSSIDTICDHAFYNHDTLEKINLENVKEIGQSAFYSCKRLTEIDITNAIILGGHCFADTGITEVTIPEGVSEIGTGAFFSCTYLTKINYNAISVTDLNHPESILGRNNDTVPSISLYIGNRVQKIPRNAFAYSKISKIEFAENSVCREIGERAFYNCLGEKTLVLAAVENVGARAFADSEITELTLGERINVVGDSAFSGCKKLTKVTISTNKGGFGSYLFSNGADSLDVYYLHNGSENVGNAFAGSKINLIIGKDVKTIPANFETSGCVLTLTFQDGSSDVTIGDKAFISSISGVLDLSSVTSIGARAFYRSGIDATLTKVIFGEGLKSIGSYAFGDVQEVWFLAESCQDVGVSDGVNHRGIFVTADTFVIGKDVKRIPANLLDSTTIKTVYFENGAVCEEIGNEAFYYAKITNLSLAASVKIIGESAFEGVTNVTNKINLNNITSFGVRAFRVYSGEIELSSPSATLIPKEAFDRANVVGTVNLDKVTNIGEGAFWGCSAVTKLVFGTNFISAGQHAFYACTGIETVEFNAANASDFGYAIFTNNNGEKGFDLIIGNEVTRIPAKAFSSSAVKSITFNSESKCKVIGASAFANTSSLNVINIHDSVERIEEMAFVLTKATSVTIGKGIKYIGKNAFVAFGYDDITDYGWIEKVYFTSNITFIATDASGNTTNFSVVANSEENAFAYASALYRQDYTYEVVTD